LAFEESHARDAAETLHEIVRKSDIEGKLLKLSPSTLYDANEECRKISGNPAGKATRSIGFKMMQGFQSPRWLALHVATHRAEAGEGASEQHESRAASRLLLGGHDAGFETVSPFSLAN
jgi:hypothetical protein